LSDEGRVRRFICGFVNRGKSPKIDINVLGGSKAIYQLDHKNV
jgi:hypothetical protein